MNRKQLAGMPLVDLRDRYRSEIFEKYLPFWESYGIDHDLGGFLCSLDHDGSVRHPADGLGFAGIFVAEGLQEFYRATGDEASMERALESIARFFEIYDDPRRDVPQWYLPCNFPGMRTLGHEEMTIRVLTQVLDQVPEKNLEARVRHSVDAVISRYWNPEYRLNDEVLTYDYRRTENECSGFAYLGHSIVTSWIILLEAMRIRDRALFDLVAERLKRHIEAAWDDPFGGLVRGMHVNGERTTDRMLWTQDEAMVGTMLLMEHTHLDWPKSWFERVYRYVEDKFSLTQYGYPLWILGSDREVTFEPHVSRKGNYHHPRQLMLNLLALERMIQREGEVSDFWR